MASFIKSDLEFILEQIRIAEAHAAGADLRDLIPNTEVAFGLRTIDGSFNNLIPGRTLFGAADTVFPRMLPAFFRQAEPLPFDPDGPGPLTAGSPTSYAQTSGMVVDSQPRIISNLIVDQTADNPAAVAAAAQTPGSEIVTGTRADGTPFQTFFIPNVAPDEGLSAPFNQWMTFFGQFFDHGLDLVNKGGNGIVFIPLQPDDPLFNPASPQTNFMVLTRATNQPGPDGVLGTADDIHEHTNQTSPFVDQNQTYSSHPSHQVFLRAYELGADGRPYATGKLIVNRDLGADGKYGTADDVVLGGMATWKVVKAQARDLLGIELTDTDVFAVPLLATDQYGNFLRGPNGYPQVVMLNPDGTTFLMEGNPAAPISLANAVRTGHAFLDDIAHTASPRNAQTGAPLAADSDTAVGLSDPGTYDNELLDRHFMAGDGRVNENIGLIAVHHVFHSEHNRLVEHTKSVILESGDLAFLNQWLLSPVTAIPADPSTLVWNGERLFQAAKFGTEMQYQHLVFEEFARTIQPQVDAFLDFDDTVNPSIVAEFAHVVYRFGHSMLRETIDRLDPNFVSSEIGLIQAFLNPLEFDLDGTLTPEQAAGAIVRGTTRQVGNEIDEFVTEALRNNLLGLPLDLASINLARGRDTGVPSLNAARRTFFEGTGDSQLAPYTSWFDFVQNIKHPESLVNFIAAYGTHESLTGATTLADKRAAAALLVFGGEGAPADRLDFLHSTGEWASGPDGVTITGLDNVDFWIGGLAERKMPFGGMLGSTFNFVFETQLEALQDGDRLYYLHRLAGLHFLSELENNSFSKLVMLNTDATHLPALIFSTPGFTLEVDQSKQFTGLGPDGRADPEGDHPLIPAVIRDNPATPGPDANYLQYTGGEHVVLGGTPGDDILIAGIGDDTLWGDEGNDRLEGGYGNDTIEGGPGDDIITDMGGDDVLKGGEGNDVIHGGNGINLIIGGPGKDFIITGEDETETFAGPGDDFILGNRIDAFPLGNEGNDWIERGTQDGAAGDNFDPFGRDPVVGHDVFLGDGGFDEMLGEGGDDIMVGSEGPDKYKGMSGFDWVTFKDDRFGVNVDMFRNAFNDAPLPPSLAAVGARFAQVEGLSGSAHADILRGDDADAVQIANAGFTGSVLTNIDLIDGLQEFLGAGVTSFGAGNIILGGDGSDIIEGRGGNDLIDGDRWLNVRISVRQNADGTGPEIASYDSMIPMIPLMLDGTYNPGQLVIVREILPGAGGFDTAVFSDIRANYAVNTFAGVTTVTHLIIDPLDPTDVTLGPDGIDRLTNIERLQFNDQSVTLDAFLGLNNDPQGQVAILDAANNPDNTPVTGQVLRASIAPVTDADNPGGTITGPIHYVWQVETDPGSGVFRDISGPEGGAPVAVGPTFTVTQDLAGFALRVKAHYQDANGVLETAFSAPTALVERGAPIPAPPPLLNAPQTGVVSAGIHFIGSDLQFILEQIKIAERHSAGEDPASLIPNARMALGLRTVDGSFNNLVRDQQGFGAADEVFPRLTTPNFRDAENVTIDLDGPGPLQVGDPTSYRQTSGFVFDSQPRIISNLIVDQTVNNPAAVVAALKNAGSLDPTADAASVAAAKAAAEDAADAALAAQAAEEAAIAASNQADADLALAQQAALDAQAAEDAALAALAIAQADFAAAQTAANDAQAAEDAALAALAAAQADFAAAQTAANDAQAAEDAALAALAIAQADFAAAQTAANDAQTAEDAALAALAAAQADVAAAQTAANDAQAAEDAALAALATAQANAATAQQAATDAQLAEDAALAALATAQANAATAQQAATDAQLAEDAALAALATAQANAATAQQAATDAQLAEDAALAALTAAQADVAAAQTAADNAQAAELAATAASNAADQAAADAQVTLDIVNGVTVGNPVAAAQAASNSAAAAAAAAQAAEDAAILAGDPLAIANATAASDAADLAAANALAAFTALQADPTASDPATVTAVQDASAAASASAIAAQTSEDSAIAVSDAADANLAAAQAALVTAEANAAAATAASDQADADLAAAQAALVTAEANAAAATAASDQADADLAAAP